MSLKYFDEIIIFCLTLICNEYFPATLPLLIDIHPSGSVELDCNCSQLVGKNFFQIRFLAQKGSLLIKQICLSVQLTGMCMPIIAFTLSQASLTKLLFHLANCIVLSPSKLYCGPASIDLIRCTDELWIKGLLKITFRHFQPYMLRHAIIGIVKMISC